MAIIERNVLTLLELQAGEKAIVKRIIHTTGNFNITPLVQIHPRAVEVGLAALRNCCTICTDVNMVLAGINRKKLTALNVKATCRIGDPEVAAQAKQTGETRARAAMRSAGPLNGDIVVIGNAPTALFALCEMIEAGSADRLLIS